MLDVRGFRGEVDRIARTYPAAAAQERLGRDEEYRIIAPVEFSAEVRKDAQKVRLTGRLRTTLQVDCGRCLEPYPVPLDAPFDLMFLPLADVVAEAAPAGAGERPEREVQEDDLGVSFYKDDVIDLGEVMREQFLLALPMKPLCTPECKGLCPVCGANRNRETCQCRSEWVDPRMEPLKKLLDR